MGNSFVLKGKYSSAIVFADYLEESAVRQIIELLNQEFTKGQSIRIMPDAHSGKGCVIGTTMTIKDKVVPNLVGVDIGCGVLCSLVGGINYNGKLKEIDERIREAVPLGFNVRKESYKSLGSGRRIPDSEYLKNLRIRDKIDLEYVMRSEATLGGGNHFIELDIDESGLLYIVVHTGSRNLGKVVAEHYQERAYADLKKYDSRRTELIQELKASGREKEIQNALKNIPSVPRELAYCEGKLLDDYLNDMKIVQEWASWNRRMIALEIEYILLEASEGFVSKYHSEGIIDTVHNYIDTEMMILRKGAVSARECEKLIIPMNMKDGSFICKGLGNSNWNWSAPHGAGRIFSRSAAKKFISLDEYRKSMKGIFSTSVNESTLDESPMAYKQAADILCAIEPTVIIEKKLIPIYNLKA